MSIRQRVALGTVGWLAMISGLHLWLNVDWPSILNDRLPAEQRKLNVAYIPVT